MAAYNPDRITAPGSVRVPLTRDGLLAFASSARNPLRQQPATHLTQPFEALLPQPRGGPAKKRAKVTHENAPAQQQQQRYGRDGDVRAVAHHYNSRQDVGTILRQESPIIGLKRLNNWIKSVLIARFARDKVRHPLSVLDMGCGKGGDLLKWGKAPTAEYLGIDLAGVSVQQAQQRWQQMRGSKFDARFLTADCFADSMSRIFAENGIPATFNVVSMQFCMHYAFETEAKVRKMLENVSFALVSGGTFVGTIPDSEQLLHRLQDNDDNNTPDRLSFGNDVYKVTFDEGVHGPRYGHRYQFFLKDAVDEVPEYVIRWEPFVQLAREYDLELLEHRNFHDVLSEDGEIPEFAQLLTNMKVFDKDGNSELSEDEFEACGLYSTFAFVKKKRAAIEREDS